MTRISCKVADCPNFIETEEPVAANPVYICPGLKDGYKLLGHGRKEVLEMLGRIYNPRSDEADKNIAFQRNQFDPGLKQGGNRRRKRESL
jgi:hypothetical protein